MLFCSSIREWFGSAFILYQLSEGSSCLNKKKTFQVAQALPLWNRKAGKKIARREASQLVPLCLPITVLFIPEQVIINFLLTPPHFFSKGKCENRGPECITETCNLNIPKQVLRKSLAVTCYAASYCECNYSFYWHFRLSTSQRDNTVYYLFF